MQYDLARSTVEADTSHIFPPKKRLRSKKKCGQANDCGRPYSNGIPQETNAYCCTSIKGEDPMAGRFITSLCPPPSKPSVGRYPPVKEPREPIPGWIDGSQAWHSTVYGSTINHSKPFHRRNTSLPPDTLESGPSRTTHTGKTASASAPAVYRCSSYYSDEELIKRYSASFVRRPDSRGHVTALKRTSTAQNVGINSSPPTVYGAISGPNSSLSGVRNRFSAQTNAGSSSRENIRNPFLAAYHIGGPESGHKVHTRPWSYDNVQTYDTMPLQRKKVKKIQHIVMDGEEKVVEVEVDEEPKRLFLFAPTVIY